MRCTYQKIRALQKFLKGFDYLHVFAVIPVGSPKIYFPFLPYISFRKKIISVKVNTGKFANVDLILSRHIQSSQKTSNTQR